MQNQAQVTEEYNASVTSIRAMLKRVSAQAAKKNFEVNPATANWGHLGDIRRIEMQVKALCDLVFQEGEYANE